MVVVSAVGHSERFSSAAGGYYVVYMCVLVGFGVSGCVGLGLESDGGGIGRRPLGAVF